MKSNIAEWQTLHRAGYFKTHRCYQNRDRKPCYDLEYLAQFKFELRAKQRVAVIGSGYGREIAVIAPLVEHVWAIDVSDEVHREMAAYLSARKIGNVTAVLAEKWQERVPQGIDLFYSITTFQHMTKDLARDYLEGIADKIRPETGRAIIQFAENPAGTDDAALLAYEPNVKWSAAEVAAAVTKSGLKPLEIKTLRGTGKSGRPWVWHWAFIGPQANPDEESL